MKSSESIQLGTKYFHPITKELRDEAGAVIPLRAQSAEVLGILIKTPGQLVEKQFFHEEVWVGTVVTDSSLAQCIADIRRAGRLARLPANCSETWLQAANSRSK